MAPHSPQATSSGRPQRLIALMYHRIGKHPGGSTTPGHYVPPELFDRHLRILKRLRPNVMPPGEAVKALLAGRLPAKSSIITFDDGCENVYRLGLPVLEKHDLPSINFLISDLVGGINEWCIREGDIEEKMMSWDEVREAQSHRMEFGSHTASHPHLTACPDDDLRGEIETSKRTIEERLGKACPLFCYPYGDHDERVVKATQRAGYMAAFSTKKGASYSESERYALRRINVRSDTSPGVLAYKVFRALLVGK